MTENQQRVLEAIDAGYGSGEMGALLEWADSKVYRILNELVGGGVIRNVSRGHYERITAPSIPQNGTSRVVPMKTAKVTLPGYMKDRPQITVTIEHSPEEIEGVVKVELRINDTWFPVPLNGDLRICIGDDVPRWSSQQETYQCVNAYRLTSAAGEQMEVAHNPEAPITVAKR